MAGPDRFDPVLVEATVGAFQKTPGGLMPALHAVQDRLGYIPRDAVPIIAKVLNLSRAEVHGVISFYHDFRSEPRGRHIVRVCRAESCQAMGARALADHICRRLGVGFGKTSGNGAFTLEPVYCLGNCACSPAIMIDGNPHGRLTAARFDELIADFKERS